nr:hypothetical protein [uncultured Flavobacterium sp.]
MITPDDFSLALQLFKWIHPSVNPYPVIWKEGDPLSQYRFYQYQKNKRTIAIWMDVPKLSEEHFKRIYKKHNLLSHEFFLTHKNGVYRFGWRIK